MKKERVIIDVWNTEDGYEIFRVYLAGKSAGVHEPPNNTHNGGFFCYDIDEEYFEEWEVVEDYRTDNI
jgi:hypothetical protein